MINKYEIVESSIIAIVTQNIFLLFDGFKYIKKNQTFCL